MFVFIFSGIFLCTDSERNVILGSCEEYLKPPGIIFAYYKIAIMSIFLAEKWGKKLTHNDIVNL